MVRPMSTVRQFVRYAIVGIVSNVLLYLVYLLLTSLGMGHKTAMSLVYLVGVLQTFYFNRSWSFGHEGQASSALIRYIAAFSVGYVFNLFALLLLVDNWGWPHQLVQGMMILVVAFMLFLAQKYWVFPAETK